ncbi:helix-turn-helix transcriptional regulator [Cytobacillus kochii]|uniref:helix-turn-helix transcriptional regulator n=1 Tax=Cytobacillus kochii TaxID=859143 RepID=UPI001CD3DF18|nr:helix-turn-helix transcriptional regulator [Cytobacillus kochii]MCA1027003.1 helix-turn-helix transcriptional regulator [Cytobacillus kochii]
MAKELVGKCLLTDLLHKSYMTQAELSEKTGISRQQLSSYVNNKNNMSLPVARKISVALNCKIDDLYEWKF